MATKGPPSTAASRAGELFDTPTTGSGGSRMDRGTQETSTATSAMTTSTKIAPLTLPSSLPHTIFHVPSPQPTHSMIPASLFEMAISTPPPSQIHPHSLATLPLHLPSPSNHILPPFPFSPLRVPPVVLASSRKPSSETTSGGPLFWNGRVARHESTRPLLCPSQASTSVRDVDFPFSRRASRSTQGLAGKILRIGASKLRSSCLFRYRIFRLLVLLLNNLRRLHLYPFFLL